MKKLIVMTSCLLCMTPALLAATGGIGLRLGYGQNDPWLQDEKLSTHGEVGGVELLEEWELANEASRVGVKLGFDIYGKNKYSQPGLEAVDNTFALPLSIYYKKTNETWSWFAGIGATWIKTKAEVRATGYVPASFSNSKIFPHLTTGAEYRFNESFAIGFDLKYNVNAKITIEDLYVSDRSGFGAAITVRYYFPMDTASWM